MQLALDHNLKCCGANDKLWDICLFFWLFRWCWSAWSCLCSDAYKKILYGPETSKKKPLGVVIVVWIFCALLYVGQVSPAAFYLANAEAGKDVNLVYGENPDYKAYVKKTPLLIPFVPIYSLARFEWLKA